MKNFFFGKCLFSYKIWFAIEKKTKFAKFCVVYGNCMASIFFKKNLKSVFFCHQSVQLFSKSRRKGLILFLLFFENVWKLYEKHFLHTFDVWNCMIMIFVVWSCMISIFGVWSATRDNGDPLKPKLSILTFKLHGLRRFKILKKVYHFQIDSFRMYNFYNCSDFRYESNGIFVLGVGFFFSSDKFRLFN